MLERSLEVARRVGRGVSRGMAQYVSRWWPGVGFKRQLSGDRGAVTAEYALVILAAVALAGVLVAIVRSDEVRTMLVELVQGALSSAG